MLVEFTLIADGENTRLRLVESGLLEMDWSDEAKAKYADEHGKGWDNHLARLGDYASGKSPASAPR